MSGSLVQFNLADGSPVFVEVVEPPFKGNQKVSLTQHGVEQAQTNFAEALAQIKPAAEIVLNAFREMNNPSEIELEFGIKLSGKVGAIFTSAAGEATFKVTLRWRK